MTDNRIDKVRTEIERVMKWEKEQAAHTYGILCLLHECRADMCNKFLSFIDSMPKDDKSETLDYIRLLLEDIGNTANRTTAGNVAHNIPSIKYRAEQALKSLNELQKPTTSVWHDAKKSPEIHRKYLTRYADGKVNGSWERHDEGFIPWKEVVKEHKFTHWCYVEDLLKL